MSNAISQRPITRYPVAMDTVPFLFANRINWGPLSCQYVDSRGRQCTAKRDHRNHHESLCFQHSNAMDLLSPDEAERAAIELRRREAALLLSAASVVAAEKLVESMDSEREDIRLRAITEVLDRTGMGKAPTVQIEVQNNTVNVARDTLVSEINARLDRLAEGIPVVQGALEESA